MIDVIVSDKCPYCEDQLDVMKKSFFEEEYRIINCTSDEFEKYDQRQNVIGVPFVVVRDDDGEVTYSSVGIHDGTMLRKIQRRGPVKTFNMSVARALSD